MDLQISESSIKHEAMTLQKTAMAFHIIDDDSYRAATDFLVSCRRSQKKIDEFCDPVIKAAHETHKAAVKQKNDFKSPILMAEQVVIPKINSYRSEQERKRRAEEEERRKEAQRIAEEDRLRLAIEMEQAGDTLAAEVVMEAPIYVAPVAIQTAVPKANGIGEREYWEFEIVNADLIPSQYKIIDEKAIAGVVRSLKDRTQIPGIKVFSRKGIAVRTK